MWNPILECDVIHNGWTRWVKNKNLINSIKFTDNWNLYIYIIHLSKGIELTFNLTPYKNIFSTLVNPSIIQNNSWSNPYPGVGLMTVKW
jgi:hypothetical protein